MYIHRETFEPLVLSGEGAFFHGVDRVPESLVVEVCDLCEEEAGPHGDVLAEFTNGQPGDDLVTLVAHAQCGLDEGLHLA